MTRPNRWIIVVAGFAVLLVAAAVLVGLWGKGLVSDAAVGKAQAEAGARSLAAQDATAAASQFAEASRSFTSLKRAMGPEWAAGALGAVPWAGRQYTAARTLVEIGLDGSTAGAKLAGVLKNAPPDSASGDPTGRFAVLLATERENIELALKSLSDAAHLADGLSAEGLVPQLAKTVSSVKNVLRGAAPFLDRTQALLQLESYLFSGNRRILVVSQNGAELRPTGGFAGSFGIIDITPSGAKLEGYHDVYELPDPPGNTTPPPGAIMTNDFGFRDANWWIDFPTSAKAMLGFWTEYRQPQVDGIMVVDTVAMRDLLGSTGPIFVPSYGETFTSANLLDRLLYLVEVKSQTTGYSGRKGVLTALAAELEKRVLESNPSDLAKSALALGRSADAKHVQLYFTDPAAQAAVDSLGWSGRVAPPAGTTDVLAVSNAMNVPGKVNIAMKKSIDYEVALQPDRSADTTLVLRYANTGPYPEGLPSKFGNWLRVYRIPGTVIPTTTPGGAKAVIMTEFGFPAEARSFMLRRQQSRTEVLTARVPEAIRTDSNDKSPSGGTAHYRLHVVRQVDLENTPTTVVVTAPAGWRVTGASARLAASGASVPVTVEGSRVRMAIPLSGDLDLDVELAPS